MNHGRWRWIAAGQWGDDEAEDAEDSGESRGHRGGELERVPYLVALVVAENEEAEVGGQEREATRIDGGQHARGEGDEHQVVSGK